MSESEQAAEIIREVNRRVTENLNGPGEKTKSGGLARGGRISQKPQQGGQQGRNGQYGGAGAGVQGPEPQAKSGEPNKKEDELEKDYLEMDDEPLDPQSPLGKVVAQAFDQPIGPPEDEEAEEDEEDSEAGKSVEEPIEDEPTDKQPVKETHRNKSSRQGRSKARAGKRQVRIDRQAAKRKDTVKEATRGKVHYSQSIGKYLINVYQLKFGKGDISIPRMKAVLVITGNDGSEKSITYPTVGAARSAATEFYIRQDIREDYQGDEQSVTNADGVEIEVDEDAYETAQKTEPTEVQQMDEPFTVHTKEGPAEGKKGDYLAKGVDGEQWPIDKKIFDKTHEFVDPEIQTGLVAQVKEAAEPTDKRGGYYIKTFKGWHIFGLPGYSTPYYYAQGHSSDSDMSIRRIQNFITKKLKAMGKETLDEAKTVGRVFINIARDGTLRYAVSDGRKGSEPQMGPNTRQSLQQVKNRFPGYDIQVRDDYGDLDEVKGLAAPDFEMEVEIDEARTGSYGGRSPIEGQPFGPFDGNGGGNGPSEATLTKSHKMTPARAEVLNRYNSDPQFRSQLDQAWGIWRNAGASPAEKKRAAKFLKGLGLVEAMREAIKSSGGGPRSMKRTSGSTEWGRTKKTGKTSKSNLRRSATKRARRQGKDQARMTEGTIVQVRPDCWAAKNMLGEVKHFTAPKIAEMYANSKGNGDFGIWPSTANIQEDTGGRWKTNARHFQPDDDDEANTIAQGMVSVDEAPDHLSSGGGTSSGSDRHGTFLGKGSLSPDEMKVIDTSWKEILKFASAAFEAKPLPVALRTIEKYLEKLGIDSSHSMKIGDVLANQLNKDRDPVSMIIPKVIPKIQQEPYTKGSGYNAGGTGGMGPR